MDIIDVRRLKSPDEYAAATRRVLGPFLLPLSALYAAGMSLWRSIPFKPVNAGVPVVSVGSLAVGGTGKTPVCMHIAGRFRDLGHRVCVLSRGYRRRSDRSPLVVSDGFRTMAGVEAAGDEPYMMAKELQEVGVVVGKDRLAAAAVARDELGAELLVLDDGFQVRNLARQVDVLCFDGDSFHRPNTLLPWGSLREGWSALKPEHLVVVVLRHGVSPPFRTELARLGGARVFYAERSAPIVTDIHGERIDGDTLAKGRFTLVSGIARPGSFESSCSGTAATIPVSVRFRDHHWYREGDAAIIKEIVDRYGCTGILTTEKDIWKLPAALLEMSLILRTQLDFLDPEGFWENLDKRLGVGKCLPKNRTSL